jgi:hypothetical protein
MSPRRVTLNGKKAGTISGAKSAAPLSVNVKRKITRRSFIDLFCDHTTLQWSYIVMTVVSVLEASCMGRGAKPKKSAEVFSHMTALVIWSASPLFFLHS